MTKPGILFLLRLPNDFNICILTVILKISFQVSKVVLTTLALQQESMFQVTAITWEILVICIELLLKMLNRVVSHLCCEQNICLILSNEMVSFN